MHPKTRYAKTGSRSGDVSIAYQVLGDGPIDLVLVPGFVSHVEQIWESPEAVRIFNRLASFSRLILFDKRGTGLSDPVVGVPTLEERMDDVRAVMDAAGSERAALFGVSEGGPMSILFAATYPERVSELVLYGTLVWPAQKKYIEALMEDIDQRWGEGAMAELFVPNYASDARFMDWWNTYLRQAASPAMARAVVRTFMEIDVREVLPAVRAPTLVIHRTDERVAPVAGARYIAEQVPDAKLVELPGEDHVPLVGDTDAIGDEIEEFLTGTRHMPEPDRMLATVMFTDIVGSTERAADLGDSRWRDLLTRHDQLVRKQIERFRGREVKSMGDGFLATFDGPARAIRCATTISEAVRQLGIEIRAGLHTGECEVMGDDLGGMAVHIGARVGAKAGPGEVLVSGTVKDLVVGSGIEFADRGTEELKGVPGQWRLYSVER